jgi:hypothetical protein
MGSEAVGSVTIRDEDGATVAHAHGVKALLESRELLLREPLRRALALEQMRDVVIEGDRLRFRYAREEYELTLGAAVAARWAKKILTPPPTLSAKLGISAESPAVVIGRVTDARLIEVLAGATTEGDALGSSADAAGVAIAEIDSAGDLERALDALPTGLPIWLAHRKGRGVEFGDAAIRQRMRALGFIDTKVSAVSDTRTATRYSPRAADGERAGSGL